MRCPTHRPCGAYGPRPNQPRQGAAVAPAPRPSPLQPPLWHCPRLSIRHQGDSRDARALRPRRRPGSRPRRLRRSLHRRRHPAWRRPLGLRRTVARECRGRRPLPPDPRTRSFGERQPSMPRRPSPGGRPLRGGPSPPLSRNSDLGAHPRALPSLNLATRSSPPHPRRAPAAAPPRLHLSSRRLCPSYRRRSGWDDLPRRGRMLRSPHRWPSGSEAPLPRRPRRGRLLAPSARAMSRRCAPAVTADVSPCRLLRHRSPPPRCLTNAGRRSRACEKRPPPTRLSPCPLGRTAPARGAASDGVPSSSRRSISPPHQVDLRALLPPARADQRGPRAGIRPCRFPACPSRPCSLILDRMPRLPSARAA